MAASCVRYSIVAVAACLGVLVLGGGLFAWSGLYSVAASAGHSEPVRWLLHFAMRRSVKRHAASVAGMPDLDDPLLVVRGAAHYRTGCAPCHGSPDDSASTIERNATPPPPPYAAIVQGWRPRELFWIVKHGVKMTAMPPWPTQERDDEVWAMVAFLRRVSAMAAATYRKLSTGDSADTRSALVSLERPVDGMLTNCFRCHGADGTGRGGDFPRLAGLSAPYMAHALSQFRSGTWPSGTMQAAVSGLSDRDIERAAGYFAQQSGPATSPSGGLREGAEIAQQGSPDRRILPCVSCHAPDAATRNPAVPPLARQSERHLVDQLLLFRDGRRRNGPMNLVARGLTDEELRAVARYFARP